MENFYNLFIKDWCIGALVKRKEYYVRVNAFNEYGISKGNTVQLQENN